MKCRNNRFAFTIIELLVVISLISILMGWLAVSLYYAMEYAKRMETEGMLSNIEMALNEYYERCGVYPADMLDRQNLKKATEVPTPKSSADLLEALDGDDYLDAGTPYLNFSLTDTTATQWHQIMNPKLASTEQLVDAWGQPLRYRQNKSMNYKYGKGHHLKGETSADDQDESMQNSIFHPNSFDLWSVGPDGKSGTKDDIYR